MTSQTSYILLNNSLAHIQASDFDKATELLLRARVLDDKNPDILRLLSVVAAMKFDYVHALELIDEAIFLSPDNALAHSNRGNILKELHRYEDALVSLDKAIALQPDYAEAYNNKGNVLQDLHRYEESLQWYDKAIWLQPDYAEAYSNKGNASHGLKRYDDAIECHNMAIKIAPRFAEAYSNMGNALYGLKRYHDAIECHDKAISIAPKFARAYTNMGTSFHALKKYDEALTWHEKSIAIDPNYDEAYSNIGNALYELKRFDDASRYYEKVLQLNPDCNWVPGFLLYLKMKRCFWANLQEELRNLAKKIEGGGKVMHPFILLSLVDSPMLQKKCAEIWSNEGCRFISTLNPNPRLLRHEKIRVGYFSADFREHPVSALTVELFELHNRERFETIAFSFGVDDQSQMRNRLKNAFDRFIDVKDLSNLDIAKLARELEIDIAIDMGGYTAENRAEIFAYRAAPIQVNYLGYPGTLGAKHIDYIIADHTTIPEISQRFYTEKVVYLPHTYVVDDSQRIPSIIDLSRRDFNLPENAFVFCSLNSDYKFNKQLIVSWSKILLSVKDSVLWVPENNKYFKANLKREFVDLGVNSDRIIFSQRVDSIGDHLARYCLADLFLDTFPYNSHTTAVDALKSGLPVITLIGDSFASRVAASLLKAVNMPELIANSIKDYESLAINLANNPEKLSTLRSSLASNLLTAPLFDTKLYVTHLEDAYYQMYGRHKDNLQPDHLYVVP